MALMDPNFDFMSLDYEELAANDVAFGTIWKTCKGKLDWNDPDVLIHLTTSTLKHIFHLDVDLPGDRLCPGVPGRYAYIRYLQKLIDSTDEPYISDEHDPTRDVLGVDIGTGASCIYPLLGCTVRPNWHFIGTDIDDKSYRAATHNIELNHFGNKIKLCKHTADGSLLPHDLPARKKGWGYDIDFIMCNPPFYSSQKEIDESRAMKKNAPAAVCTGAEVEMITAGGELAFVLRIVKESAGMRERIQWFTSLLGFHGNIDKIRVELRKLDVTNWCIGELAPGSGVRSTKRWVIAWSFGNRRPCNSVVRSIPWPTADLAPTLKSIAIPAGIELRSVPATLNTLLSDATIWGTHDEDAAKWLPAATPGTPSALIHVGDFIAKATTWDRRARRERQRDLADGAVGSGVEGEPPRKRTRDGVEGQEMQARLCVDVVGSVVLVRWLVGSQVRGWESFSGKVEKEVKRVWKGK